MGGAGVYLRNIVQHLACLDRDNEYFLLVGLHNRDIFQTDQSNFHQVMLPGKMSQRPLRIFIENFLAPFFSWRVGADVIFSPNTLPPWTREPSVLLIQNLLYYHFEQLVAPTIKLLPLTSRLYSRAQDLYYRAAIRNSIRRADRVISVSNNTQRETLDFACTDHTAKFTVIPHGVGKEFRVFSAQEVQEAREHLPQLPNRFILSVTTVSPYKNVDKLISAYELFLRLKNVDHKLVIVGHQWPGYFEEIQSLVLEKGLSQNVLFLPYTPSGQMPAFYNLSDVAVLLSSCESFGLPIIEAMACGKPVVVSNRSSLPEVSGSAGILVDPNDPTAVAKALHTAVSNPTVRQRMITQGLERAATFTWEKTAKQTLEVLREAATS